MAWRESWWPQELPIEGELQEGLRNLERYHYEVDYVVTHCCGSSLQERLNAGTGRPCAADLLTDYLEILEQKLHYKHWYFGHFHCEKKINKMMACLFFNMINLSNKKVIYTYYDTD